MANREHFKMAEKRYLSDNSEEEFTNKRARIASDMSGYYTPDHQVGNERGSDPHTTEPSCVVHVRGVADEAKEQDLLEVLSPFGKIR